MRGSSIESRIRSGLSDGGLLKPDVAVVDDGGRAAEVAELGPQLAGEGDVALEHEDFGGHGS